MKRKPSVYNQKYRTLVERVERKPVDKIDSYVELEQYIKDRAQAAVTYIMEYGNNTLWNLEKRAPIHKLTQRLQFVFGRVNTVRKAVDEAIEKR